MKWRFILVVVILLIMISLAAAAPNVTAANKVRIKESFKNNTFLPITSGTTCSAIWGGNCSEGPPESFKNTFDACGTGSGQDESINEMYLNQSQYLLGSTVEVTCSVMIWEIMKMALNETDMGNGCEWGWTGDRVGIYYKSPNSAWLRMNYSSQAYSCFNYSASFPLDNVAGVHQIRCLIGYKTNPNDECPPSADYYDADDINFSVLPPYISITLENAPIDFGDNANPGSTTNAINNPLTIRVDSNIRFNITTQANSDVFLSESGTDSFPVGNMQWQTSLSSQLIQYTLSPALVYSNQAAGIFSLYHKLTVPNAQPQGSYSSDITITALAAS